LIVTSGDVLRLWSDLFDATQLKVLYRAGVVVNDKLATFKQAAAGLVPLLQSEKVGVDEAEDNLLRTLLPVADLPVGRNGRTILHHAAEHGSCESVELLLRARANVAAVDNDGTSVLMFACQNLTHSESVVGVLLRAGADPTARSSSGNSCLHFAVRFAGIETLDLLLNTGKCDIDAVGGPDLCTPLLVAVKARARPSIVRRLLRCGAFIDAVDKNGRGALHFAVHGVDINLIQLLQEGAAVDVIDTEQHKSPCQLACEMENVHLVRLLLAAGDVDVHRFLGSQAARDKFNVACNAASITKAGFGAIWRRATEICVALHDLDLDAMRLHEIVTHACTPFARRLPFHWIWKLVTKVRHFHDKKRK
jgi:ankyrin repeat protein